ncbi:MAG: hypothetical protein R6X19_06660 [Kiritimatiellia bacterium]
MKRSFVFLMWFVMLTITTSAIDIQRVGGVMGGNAPYPNQSGGTRGADSPFAPQSWPANIAARIDSVGTNYFVSEFWHFDGDQLQSADAGMNM